MPGILRRVAERRHARLNEQVRAADALEAEGRWEEARSLYARVLSRESANSAALRRLAALHQLDGRAQEAEALWRRLAEKRPERADAHLQLARLSLRRGAAEEALGFAERAVALAPPGRAHEIAHRARSLRDHLKRGESTPTTRHVAIGGMSFCGSTLLGFLLGSLPAVTNVGESHSLAYRRQGMGPVPVNFSSDDPEELIPCTTCGNAPCPVWTLPFRHALAADPVDWYERLAVQAGTPILVSSDKSHAKLSGLDPFGRFDLIVLFKTPSVAFASARRRPRPPKKPGLYMERWEREYRRLLHDLPAKGRRIVLHFDAFRRDPEVHLRRLIELLDVPVLAGQDLLTIDPEQHVMGGNMDTRRDLLDEGNGLVIRVEDAHALPELEAEQIAEREARSPVFRELRELHAEAFEVSRT